MLFMKDHFQKKVIFAVCVNLLLIFIPIKGLAVDEKPSNLSALIPDLPHWSLSEEIQCYYPDFLYEYINGAAEIYLSYDFQELLVAQYSEHGSESSLSIEIYDMASDKNAFGIYSAERFPDNRFVPVGIQGYEENEMLNFWAGRFYIKILCFDCGGESARVVRDIGHSIDANVIEKSAAIPILQVFPQEGLVPNTEKFILRNFLGYEFLHDGYMAQYSFEDQIFECFLIEGRDEKDASAMLKMYLKKKGKNSYQEIPGGFCVDDPYYHKIFLVQAGRILCGVMNLRPDYSETAKAILKAAVENAWKYQDTF